MLTREQVRRLARYSYARGLDLYQQNKVISMDREEDAQHCRIDACVKGSGRKRYEVKLSIEKETDKVAESYCECPAFFSYEGLCKHCVAVLLTYIKEQDRQAAAEFLRARKELVQSREALQEEGGVGQPDEGKASGIGISGSGRRITGGTAKRKTTAKMKELLQKQTIRQTLPLLQSQTCGKVRLEPLLFCGRRESTVEFRIGVTKMYVLKDVFQFARSMQEHEDYAYGKNLQFVHTMESFDSGAVPLARFLLDWVRKNKDRYVQSGFYGVYYEHSLPKLRSIPLDGWGMEAFLDAVGETPFLANVDGAGERIWKAAPETLERQVLLLGKTGGMEVSLDPVFGYDCVGEYVYFKEQQIYRCPKERFLPIQDFLECMQALPGQTAFVQREDMPAFFRQMLPALKECCECKVENIREEDLGIVPAVFRFYLDLPQKDLVTCKALAVYGEREYSVYDHGQDVELRDLWKEAEIGKIVSGYCNAYEEGQQHMVLQGDEELLYALLTEGIPCMQELGEVYISDALKRLRIIQPPKVSVGVSLSGDLLELTIRSEDMPKEQLIEILSRYDRKKRFYRLKDGSFLRMEEDGLAPLQEIRKTLQLSGKQLQQDTIEVPRYRTLYLDEALRANGSVSVYKDRNWKALIRNMKTVEDNDFEVPESLKGVLREYQKYGFLWLKTLCHNGFGGILADDMGLGKTLQVICFLQSEMEQADRRCLIVCPASLVYNWKRELEKFAPQLPARMVVGSAAERKEILQNAGRREILITSYDLLRRDLEHYEKLSFFCQVIDEAQYIKNHGTQAARAVKTVTAGFKLALTGTPVENRLSELWSIFDYLMPGYLYAYQRFREELEQPIVQKDEEEAAVRLQKMIRPFVLRRLKKDVLKDLPDKLEENMYAAMEGEQQQLYDAHVKRMQLMLEKTSDEEFKSAKLQILAELTKLRQLCCDPALLYEGYRAGSAKTDMAVNLIRNAVENGHKVLLFSQFTSMLERLAQALREEKIAYHMLTGTTPKEKRAEMVEAFAGDDVPVFCISLKAGGTGLNLTAADVVIHFDPWWNVAVQNQATDRAHRIGQKNTINVYRLIARDTIEEKIVDLQARKSELADRILGGGGVGTGSLTREELMDLLR